MRGLLMVIAFLCFLLDCHSQNSYKGKLVSAMTGKPVKSATIELNEKIVADSDSLGYFEIELDSTYKNIVLVIWSYQTGWVAAENLNFKSGETLIIQLNPECLYSAKKDIKENNIKLLITFGFPVTLLKKKDYSFEKKYKLTYVGYGDHSGGIVADCIETYNYTIGLFLDKKYGKQWRKEVNKDVMGL